MPIYWTAASIPGFENLSRTERRRAYRLAVGHVPSSRRVFLGALLGGGWAFIGTRLALTLHLGIASGSLLVGVCAGIGVRIYTHLIVRDALPFIPASIAELRR